MNVVRMRKKGDKSLSELPISKMCNGCGHNCFTRCDIISDPTWVYKHRNGQCFAYMTPEQVKQVEKEIEDRAKGRI